MAIYSLKSSTTQTSGISRIALALCTLAFTFTGLFANALDTARVLPSAQMTSTDSTEMANAIAHARYLRSIYKTDQAIELLYGLITPGAIESEVFSEIAECHIQNGEYEAAEGIYYMVTSQNPDNLKYQIRHFSVLLRLKAYQTAAETGRKVLALDSIPAIMTLTGDCWNYMESYDSALVYYNMSLRYKPMNESVVSKAAKIHLGRQEYGMVISMADSGTCSIFLFTEPLAGWRYTEAKEQRTRIDWAESIKWLLDEQYPDAEQVILVCDNLNTHKIASLYEAFPPDEALRLAKRLEIHHTPKHGS